MLEPGHIIEPISETATIAVAESKSPSPGPDYEKNDKVSRKRFSWSSLRPFSGIIADIKARLPYYLSDWTDAYNYRVLPATALIFFANVLPGIAFSLDLVETTGEYGVAEVLVSSFMAATIFSIFGAQPLCIAGVTGPITVLNKTIFDILKMQQDPPVYLHFVGWVYLWAAIMHWVAAIFNSANFLRYVTLFSCDTFGFYVSWVYLQYGVQMIVRQFETSSVPSAYVSVILAMFMLVTGHLFRASALSNYCHRHVRRFLGDYGMPISVVASSAMAYWGMFNQSSPAKLPTGTAFQAAGGRNWIVPFWQLEGKWVGMAFPFGLALFILFLFDHQVSSLMAQGSQFPLRKPPGFHYDFALLGITTLVAGLLGVPAPNGLIPQAPIHTQSLCVYGPREKVDTEINEKSNQDSLPGEQVAVQVVEQRVSNLAQGALGLVLLTGPFLRLLSFIPRGVLAGLFWYMGTDALLTNGVTVKLLYLIQDEATIKSDEPLRRARRSRIILFAATQVAGFGATFAITQTIAAIGFPLIIFLLVPFRTLVIPYFPFTPEELSILDGPAASPFTMASVSGQSMQA